MQDKTNTPFIIKQYDNLAKHVAHNILHKMTNGIRWNTRLIKCNCSTWTKSAFIPHWL